MGERGITLSGGQRQRVALARALASEPRILMLDDTLSSVDAQTEREILTRLRPILRERTSIVVSHRVAAVKEADQILVLDGGRVAERGTHGQLLASGGLYASLYREQLAAEALGEPGAVTTTASDAERKAVPDDRPSARRSTGRCCGGSSRTSGRTGTGIALAIALLPVAAAIELAQPYLLKKAIDEHIAVGRARGPRSAGRPLPARAPRAVGRRLRADLPHAARRPEGHERPARPGPRATCWRCRRRSSTARRSAAS